MFALNLGAGVAYPAQLGYRFPPEWARHRATWLSWIHNEESWPGVLDEALVAYTALIRELALVEKVCINVSTPAHEAKARKLLTEGGVRMGEVSFYPFPTNDGWCRDHGPAFLVNPAAAVPKVIVDWGFNAWGGKYPPFTDDDQIPTRIGEALGLPVYHAGIIMEGGSVEFNGAGTILTTRSCLLNENRNPHLSQGQIEDYLRRYYGSDHILWLGDGIVGDDTDGHIDDIVRFVNEDTVITVVEHDRTDDNYHILQENLAELKTLRLPTGKQLNIVELPMPRAIHGDNMRLPASYANFYIANGLVAVPVFNDPGDQAALDIIGGCFPGRKIVGIDCRELIYGLGAFHCLTQQEPL